MGFGTLLLTAGGRVAQMAAHVTDEVWTEATAAQARWLELALEIVQTGGAGFAELRESSALAHQVCLHNMWPPHHGALAR